MLTEDWMMRQVEALARSIAYLVFQKEDTAYTLPGRRRTRRLTELYRTCWSKVNAGDIGGAEDLSLRRAIPATGVIWSWRWTSMPGSTT